MIGPIKTGTLRTAQISAVVHEGLNITANGQPCQLAIINADGQIIESGEQVAREAFAVAVESYKNMLKGMGHLRVFSGGKSPAKAA